MIDLSGIKFCFMDFDDTICLIRSRVPNLDYYDCMVRGDWKFFDRPNRAVGKGIHAFVRCCTESGVELNVITWSDSNVKVKAELGWLNHTFGEGVFTDVITTASREYKIEVMKQFAHAYGLPNRKIMLIDDIPGVLDLAHSEGFSVASPQEIALDFG